MGEEKKSEKPKCVETVSGVQCTKDAQEGSNYCQEHDPSLHAKKGGGGGGWGFGHGPVYSPKR